jgi:hypothetical protein
MQDKRHRLLFTVILLVVGFVAGQVSRGYFSSQSTSEAWLAIATFLLVGVTGYYAWQTRNTVGAIEKSRQAQFLPHVKMWIFMLGPTYPLLKIGNVGAGPAMSVAVNFRVREFNGSDRTWKTPLLSPGDPQQFWIPIGPDKKDAMEEALPLFEKNQSTLTMEASYNDILGKSHQTSDVIDITEWVRQFAKVSMIWDQERLKLIQEEIEKIGETLEPIARIANEVDGARVAEAALKYLKDRDQKALPGK